MDERLNEPTLDGSGTRSSAVIAGALDAAVTFNEEGVSQSPSPLGLSLSELNSDGSVLGFGAGREAKIRYFLYRNKTDNDLRAGLVQASVFEGSDKEDSDEQCSEDCGEYGEYSETFSLIKLWKMSIAYLDPGNLESDLQCGAVAGYSLIWVLFWATVLGWALQTLALRLATVTGRHLAEMCRSEFSKPTALALWILTELAIIGSDIQEVIGTSVALSILFGWPLWLGCCVTGLDTLTFLLLHYLGQRALEAFFCALVSTMLVCFAIEFSISNPNTAAIMTGWVVPRIRDRQALKQAVGMIGAVIMPHNLFLHSALVQEKPFKRTNKNAVKEAHFYLTTESGMSLFFSFVINLCLLSVFAKGFANNRNDNYQSDDIGLDNASDALKDEFGSTAKYIWAIGLLAAGQSSTMCGALAGQFVMQGFLELRWPQWKRVLFTRSLAIVPALGVAILAHHELDQLDEWLNVQQSVQLPFALLPLFFFSADRRVMGDFALSRRSQIVYWVIIGCLLLVNTYLILEFALGGHWKSSWRIASFVLFCLIYLGAVGFLIRDFLKYQWQYSTLLSGANSRE